MHNVYCGITPETVSVINVHIFTSLMVIIDHTDQRAVKTLASDQSKLTAHCCP